MSLKEHPKNKPIWPLIESLVLTGELVKHGSFDDDDHSASPTSTTLPPADVEVNNDAGPPIELELLPSPSSGEEFVSPDDGVSSSWASAAASPTAHDVDDSIAQTVGGSFLFEAEDSRPPRGILLSATKEDKDVAATVADASARTELLQNVLEQFFLPEEAEDGPSRAREMDLTNSSNQFRADDWAADAAAARPLLEVELLEPGPSPGEEFVGRGVRLGGDEFAWRLGPLGGWSRWTDEHNTDAGATTPLKHREGFSEIQLQKEEFLTKLAAKEVQLQEEFLTQLAALESASREVAAGVNGLRMRAVDGGGGSSASSSQETRSDGATELLRDALQALVQADREGGGGAISYMTSFRNRFATALQTTHTNSWSSYVQWRDYCTGVSCMGGIFRALAPASWCRKRERSPLRSGDLHRQCASSHGKHGAWTTPSVAVCRLNPPASASGVLPIPADLVYTTTPPSLVLSSTTMSSTGVSDRRRQRVLSERKSDAGPDHGDITKKSDAGAPDHGDITKKSDAGADHSNIMIENSSASASSTDGFSLVAAHDLTNRRRFSSCFPAFRNMLPRRLFEPFLRMFHGAADLKKSLSSVLHVANTKARTLTNTLQQQAKRRVDQMMISLQGWGRDVLHTALLYSGVLGAFAIGRRIKQAIVALGDTVMQTVDEVREYVGTALALRIREIVSQQMSGRGTRGRNFVDVTVNHEGGKSVGA